MGCAGSNGFEKLMHNKHFPEWSQKFNALQISRNEVRDLYKVFCKADLDGGGTINLLELLTIVDVERTPFTKRVFSIFDDDGSGEIDFGEFVLALWNYCTLSKVALAMFAFDLYDRDCSGVLEGYDLENMLKDIYGKGHSTNHYAKQVSKDLAELEAKGEVRLDAFLTFTRTHHSLLWPAFQMQLYLKKKMLGVRFWNVHSERRVKLCKNKYVRIKDLLNMHAKGQLDTLDVALQPGTQVVLESIGTKADRVKAKKLNDPNFGANDPYTSESKKAQQQEFMKNYMTGDYNTAAAEKQRAEAASARRAKAANSSNPGNTLSSIGTLGSGSADSKDRDSSQPTLDLSNESAGGPLGGGFGGSDDAFDASASLGPGIPPSSKTNNINNSPNFRKKSMITSAGAPIELMRTVMEDLSVKERKDDYEEAQQELLDSIPRKAILKPAQDQINMAQSQAQKRSSFLATSMKAKGMDSGVVEHIVEARGSVRANGGPIVLANTGPMGSNAAHNSSNGTLQSSKYTTANSSSQSVVSGLVSTRASAQGNGMRSSWFGGIGNASAKVATLQDAPDGSGTAVSTKTSSAAVTTGNSSQDAVTALLTSTNTGGANRGLRTHASAGSGLSVHSAAAAKAVNGNDGLSEEVPNNVSNNSTTALMAHHKRRAQRRASVA